ncbi:MAG: hypothetical protein QOF70_4479 [Acetobacteraceae bacterium]|nr:hypothetical protein [Acetobacteraceae bacterium]
MNGGVIAQQSRPFSASSVDAAGNKLVDRQPVRMLVRIGANDDGRHEQIVAGRLIDVLTGLNDRHLDRVGEGALYEAGLVD